MSDMPEQPDVRLEIGNSLYGGWTSITIKRGLGQLAGTFDLAVTERWPGQTTPRPIQPGAACRVLVGGAPVITGYVDDVSIEYSGAAHSVSVSGRDKTGDLVDCCPPTAQIRAATYATIARALAAPYGIAVVDHAGAGAVPGLAINPGDTVFEVLEQLARSVGVLLTTDGHGRLVILRAPSSSAPDAMRAVLELGRNVMAGKATYSMRDRYSQITVLSQTAAGDTWSGPAAAQAKSVVYDAAVPRHRPLILIAEQEHQGINARAQWEANTRYGKGATATYTVYGWTTRAGLWSPGMLVDTRDGLLGLEATWLLSAVSLVLDDRGYRSEITLHPPEAYAVEPIAPRRKKKNNDAVLWPGASTGGKTNESA